MAQAQRDDWQAKGPGELLGECDTDRQTGLGASQVPEKPPSVWAVALQQVLDPVNILLVAVIVICIVGLLVAPRIILGAR